MAVTLLDELESTLVPIPPPVPIAMAALQFQIR
jgi:hypothetical protein